ncbi:MAG: hypothetical protein ACQET8_23200 [Bacillota bacterium]
MREETLCKGFINQKELICKLALKTLYLHSDIELYEMFGLTEKEIFLLNDLLYTIGYRQVNNNEK